MRGRRSTKKHNELHGRASEVRNSRVVTIFFFGRWRIRRMESSRVGRGGLFGIASDGGSQQVPYLFLLIYVSDCGEHGNNNGVGFCEKKSMITLK